MKKWLLAVIVCTLVAAGCTRCKMIREPQETDGATEKTEEGESPEESLSLSQTDGISSGKKPVKVKGIYISGRMAGDPGLEEILESMEGTEINAVVIDVKNDDGRISFAMEDAATVNEIGASVRYIRDIDKLMAELKSRGLYTIARVVAFRDPYLAEKKPEWSLKTGDGSLYRDSQELAWVNPYDTEVWDYLVEVGTQAAKVGFDEIQFDYIRFSTENTMNEVVFDEEDTRGRTKSEIITEFIQYAYDKLSVQDVFVSADVFGTIIGSQVDAETVGQAYSEMAAHLDYICPMIYPSHYGDGNFKIKHPDMEPYRTVLAALKLSQRDLKKAVEAGGQQAIVRPWLQDFTANYLEHYIPYGPKEVREQIQAVYDAGYDEWILWNASNRYTWEGILSKEEGEAEAKRIARAREILRQQTEETSVPVVEETGSAVQTDAANTLQTEADTSLEYSLAETEETAPQEKDKKKENRTKPNVVIVTTGISGE